MNMRHPVIIMLIPNLLNPGDICFGIKLMHCFRSKASFCRHKFLRPSPPLCFGLWASGHATKFPPRFFSEFPPQRHCFLILSTLWITPLCSLKVLIAYVTVGVSTVLIYSTLREYERRVEHVDNLLSTLSKSGANSSIFGLVVPRGKPR